VIEPGAYPTPIMAKLNGGEDPARKAAYGDMAKIPEMVSTILRKSQANPQEIADMVSKIIETRAGQRQLRYRVGANDLGVRRINALTDEVQAQLLEVFGMIDMTRFRQRRAHAMDSRTPLKFRTQGLR
jgi:hypothetical protein